MRRTLILFTSLALTATQVGCRSFEQRTNRSSFDDASLVDVSDEHRSRIGQARAELAERHDQLASAEQDMENERLRLGLARAELDAAREEVDKGRKLVELREKSPTSQTELEEARQSRDFALDHLDWAKELIAYHEARIVWTRTRAELARRRADQAAALLELDKAEAVRDSRSDTRLAQGDERIDLHRFRSAVEDAASELSVTEIETDAAQAKARARLRRLEDRAAEVPEAYRTTWLPVYGEDLGDQGSDTSDS